MRPPHKAEHPTKADEAMFLRERGAIRMRRDIDVRLTTIIRLALLGAASLTSPMAGADEPMSGHAHAQHPHGPAMDADHASHHSAQGHAHGVLEVADDVPRLAVALMPDASSGWNVHLQVNNFVFAPTLANGPHRPGTGHAHVYVDGVKLARVYAPWFHLPALGPGRHELRFVLNSNDHREYAYQGHVVEQRLVIEEP